MYLTILILATGIFILFRFLSFLNKKIPFSNEFKHYSGFILPVVELASWLGFVIWSMRMVYEQQAYTTLIIFGILVLLFIVPAWFLIRDFLYGMLLKIQRKIELGVRIEIGDLKGLVTKTDHFTFDIKSKNGNVDTIPYNKIRSKVISKSSENINLEKQLFRFSFASEQESSALINQLKITLLNAPWVAVSQEPIIKEIKQDAGRFEVDVFVYLIKTEHAEKLQEYVTRNFIQTLKG
jgi:hypothetical protein